MTTSQPGLLGQLAADALIRDALVIALMEVIPDLHARLQSKVAAAAPGIELGLPAGEQYAFHTRAQDFLTMLSNA